MGEKLQLIGPDNWGTVMCYLDSLLFAMFARLNSFEPILCQPTDEVNHNHNHNHSHKHFEDKKLLIVLLRLYVSLLRSGKLITTDITHLLCKVLARVGFKEAMSYQQQDAASAFIFLTEQLDMPLLTLKVDIQHGGKEEQEDDHKTVKERLIYVPIPEADKGAEDEPILLEECLEEYFSNAVSVMRHIERRKTLDSLMRLQKDSSNLPTPPPFDRNTTSNSIKTVTRPRWRTDSLNPDVQYYDSSKTGSLSSKTIPESDDYDKPFDSVVETVENEDIESGSITPTSEIPDYIDDLGTVIVQDSVDLMNSSDISHNPASAPPPYTPSGFLARSDSMTKDQTLVTTTSRGRSSTIFSTNNEVLLPAWMFLQLLPFYTDLDPEISSAQYFASRRPVLVICLKRYNWTANGTSVRNGRRVIIPSVIDLPHFVADDDQDDEPALYGNFRLILESAVCHRGKSINSGHFVSMIANRDLGDNDNTEWLLFDDMKNNKDKVKKVDFNWINTKETPYMLFYRMVDNISSKTTTTTVTVAPDQESMGDHDGPISEADTTPPRTPVYGTDTNPNISDERFSSKSSFTYISDLDNDTDYELSSANSLSVAEYMQKSKQLGTDIIIKDASPRYHTEMELPLLHNEISTESHITTADTLAEPSSAPKKAKDKMKFINKFRDKLNDQVPSNSISVLNSSYIDIRDKYFWLIKTREDGEILVETENIGDKTDISYTTPLINDEYLIDTEPTMVEEPATPMVEKRSSNSSLRHLQAPLVITKQESNSTAHPNLKVEVDANEKQDQYIQKHTKQGVVETDSEPTITFIVDNNPADSSEKTDSLDKRDSFWKRGRSLRRPGKKRPKSMADLVHRSRSQVDSRSRDRDTPISSSPHSNSNPITITTTAPTVSDDITPAHKHELSINSQSPHEYHLLHPNTTPIHPQLSSDSAKSSASASAISTSSTEREKLKDFKRLSFSPRRSSSLSFRFKGNKNANGKGKESENDQKEVRDYRSALRESFTGQHNRHSKGLGSKSGDLSVSSSINFPDEKVTRRAKKYRDEKCIIA